MKSNLKILLEEFLEDELVDSIVARAKELGLVTKVRKMKGRWNREVLRKLIKERGNQCSYCKANGNDEILTLDHIISKKILLDMGLDEFYDDEENLDVLCKKCNSYKGSQLDFSNPKTIMLLEKYIKLYKDRHA